MATTTTAQHQPPLTVTPRLAAPGPLVVTRAVLNETGKSLLLLWRHRVLVLLELFSLAIFYPFIQFVIGNGAFDRALLPPTLLAFPTLPLLFIATMKLVGDLLEEINSGTFEQLHLSPVSPAWLLVGRILGLIIEGMLIAAILTVGLALALSVTLPLRPAALLPAALTVLDVLGFALLIGGLTLRLPQIGALAHVSNGLIFALNGMLLPVDLYPGWVQGIARVFPTTLGIEALRKTMLDGQSLFTIWASDTLPWLVVHAVGLAALGGVVFLVNDRRIKQHGLSH
jgi:ABC-2 type transport system permease protein